MAGRGRRADRGGRREGPAPRGLPPTTEQGGHMFRSSISLRRFGAMLLAAPVLTTAAIASAQHGMAPPGWQTVSNVPWEYDVGSEPARRDGGRGWIAASVRFSGKEPTGATLLQQSVRADDFRGRRIRLTGWM